MWQKICLLTLIITGSIWYPLPVQADSYTYTTNAQWDITHDTAQEQVFFATPTNEVAYNVHQIIAGNQFVTLFHGEPRYKKTGSSSGDSVKIGLSTTNSLVMPSPQKYVYWGNATDPTSLLYSLPDNTCRGNSGGGNPMLVAGKNGDPYTYIFFITVADDNLDRDCSGSDFRHWLNEGRTKDFVTFDLLTDQAGQPVWKTFSEADYNAHPAAYHPYVPKDTDGKLLVSTAQKNGSTQGMIGSIVYLNQTYYYFYTDYLPGTQAFSLFVRTAPQIQIPTSTSTWSAPINLTPLTIPAGLVYKVAYDDKTKSWVYAMITANQNGRTDLCIDYLQTNGPTLYYNYYTNFPPTRCLHAKGTGDPWENWQQQDLLTDKYGHLIAPPDHPEAAGQIFWTDFNASNSPSVVIWGAPVWRAWWTIKPNTYPTLVPPPTDPPTPLDFDNDHYLSQLDYWLLQDILKTGAYVQAMDLVPDSKIDIYDLNKFAHDYYLYKQAHSAARP